MHYVYCWIGFVISLFWSLVSSILSIIPVCLVGGVYLLKLYSGTATINQWWICASILSLCYITFTEFGCWILQLLNHTVIDNYLSKIAYRIITVFGVGIIFAVLYILQYILGTMQ